jgi:hypothetical protein
LDPVSAFSSTGGSVKWSAYTPPSTPVQPDPTPTPTPTAAAAPDAPGVDSGVFVDPTTGALRVDENTGVALGVAVWLLAVVGGLATAWLVMP